ncbi:hypothetical protein ACFQS7_11855 [Dankookia sp. GCM10030260]|uniref:hypothetical protein n=1 Tax=Dankookia sp. GCM10030260 TaxID=3273390 RepID=UPI0036235502
MRLLTLATLGLMLAASPAFAVAPAARTTTQAKAPAGKAQLKAPVAKASAGHGRVRQVAYRPGAASAACSRKSRRCHAGGVAPARFGWAQGLPVAAGVQANECPDGTLATLARGHEDVVRCMPI